MRDNTTETAPAEPAVSGDTMRAGEYIHYYANLLTLFRESKTPAEIEVMAHAAVDLRTTRIGEFATRLESLQSFYRATSGSRFAQPHLEGWDAQRIEALREQHGGLLLAAFHYGEHRHVVADLAALGIGFVAPIAKRNYFDAVSVFADAPTACANAPLMIEVEQRNVGRTLLTSLRRGRVGLIYVDGNMGPDGHLVAEGGTEIGFLGRRISVKTGIARLALSLKLPILPLLSIPGAEPGQPHRIMPMEPILPSAAGVDATEAETWLMQRCYDALASAVTAAPEHWEFAFCLHRWLRDASVATPLELAEGTIAQAQRIEIDPSTVIEYPRDDGVYWLHVGRQRAYRLPEWSRPLYAVLRDQSLPAAQIATLVQDQGDPAATHALLQQLASLELVRAA
jgi:lauroyl/myristoyl acyltransferase